MKSSSLVNVDHLLGLAVLGMSVVEPFFGVVVQENHTKVLLHSQNSYIVQFVQVDGELLDDGCRIGPLLLSTT